MSDTSAISPLTSAARNLPVFVTGASGFIGGKITERLLGEGRLVRVLSRQPLPHLKRLGVDVIAGDLDNHGALFRGCEGAGTVFHVAGRVGVWGTAAEFFGVNLEGTRNVISMCRLLGVPRFVYTSSPSVVYNGGDLAGVDESAPLCRKAPCAYPVSKAAAEHEVAQAHFAGLATVSLRPHLVWGPGDRNVVPRVLALARRGRLKIVGSGRNKVDVTHISNVVDAHLLAERALAERGGAAGGNAYFITNGEPLVLWDWINELLRGVGIPEVKKRVPLGVAYLTGGVMEAIWNALPLLGEPPMTRFVAKELATDHWFNIDAARRDLGYTPRVTMAAGTAELIEHLKSNSLQGGIVTSA
jgi:nucleoside-diphosphate-sugar epimerase